MSIFDYFFGKSKKGASAGAKDAGPAPGGKPKEILPSQLEDLIAKRFSNAAPPQILDVREPPELARSGWIPGMINIPMKELTARMNELDPEYPVVVYCAHGVRSYKAACFLVEQGFKNVSSLSGGFAKWPGKIKHV